MNSYRQLLRREGALPLCASAFVARMPMAMYSLGTVLMITSLHGSYALAGGVAATGVAASAALLTRVGAWADRFGPRRVLASQSAFFCAATAAFIVCAELQAPIPLLFVTGTLGAATMPALGAMVRSGWGVLCGSDDLGLQLAFALESVNDDLIFIVGPVLTAFLATSLYPAAGIGAAAALSVAGVWCFIRQPCVRPGPAAAEPARTRTGVAPARSRRWVLPAPGLLTLAPVLVMFGAATASIELSTVAFATAHGHRSLAGLILGVAAIGSGAGGLYYGSRNWRAAAYHRFAVIQVMSAGAIGVLWLAPGITALCFLVLLAGAVTSPIFITAYSILEQQARQDRKTEALSWVGSSVCTGAAAGSALTGWSIDASGARGGYLVAAACAALAAVMCLAGLPSPRQSHRRHNARQRQRRDGQFTSGPADRTDLQHPYGARDLHMKDSAPATNDAITPIDIGL
jgi:MFS family permease